LSGRGTFAIDRLPGLQIDGLTDIEKDRKKAGEIKMRAYNRR
jgi:hypothetical protein